MIKANVFEKKLIVDGVAVSDSVKFETVKFTFPESWNGYKKTAVFTSGEEVCVNVVLDEDSDLCVGENECYIPFEVLVAPEFELSVFGILNDSVVTTTVAKIKVLQSGYAEGSLPSEPTPSEYQQLINLAEETKEIAQSVREDADNGVFEGEQGLQGEKGDKGEQGDKGEKGDKGEQGEVSLNYVNYTFANAIKLCKSGNCITANDVSPFEHNLEVKVKRNPKNFMPYPFVGIAPNSSVTVNGVTFTDNGDGTITANGTATANASIKLYADEKIFTGIHIVSGCPANGGSGKYGLVYQVLKDNVSQGYWIESGSGIARNMNNETFKLEARVYAGYTANNIVFKPQFEVGNKPTEFAPYVDVSKVSVGVRENNLLSVDSVTVPYAEETVVFEGVEEGKFILSFDYNLLDGLQQAPLFEIRGVSEEFGGGAFYVEGNINPFLFNGIINKVTMYNWHGATSGSIDNISLTKTVLANADGIVEGLKSVSPKMTLITDTNGVFIECAYNADTKMYIDNKFAELTVQTVS
ncbi:MAG: collagen-like protein [Ruminococcaceae bacterium]|nr:collagen-like protein [Oscillospiraceae bacterium]